jgi:hypothetical protein
MKRGAGCSILGCMGLVGLGLVTAGIALLTTIESGPEPEPEPSGAVRPRSTPTPKPQPTLDPERYLSNVDELREFKRDDEPGRFRLTYGFVDYSDHPHHVTCTIDRATLERQRAGYGYDPAQIETEENARLQAAVEREIARRGLTRQFQFKVSGDHYQWGPLYDANLGSEEAARVAAEQSRLEAWIQHDLEGELDVIRAELYGARGIARKRNMLSIDYANIAAQGTAPLEDCFQALEGASRGFPRRQKLGFLLAFFQELTYELPPDKEGRRETLGFWVPSDVMVRGRGDCDSKSAAFASLWRHFSGGLMLIVLPKHVLVGVEATPGPGENFVRLGNRYFLLCEVAGPGKFHPGEKKFSGSFEYVMIEPIRGSES